MPTTPSVPPPRSREPLPLPLLLGGALLVAGGAPVVLVALAALVPWLLLTRLARVPDFVRGAVPVPLGALVAGWVLARADPRAWLAAYQAGLVALLDALLVGPPDGYPAVTPLAALPWVRTLALDWWHASAALALPAGVLLACCGAPLVVALGATRAAEPAPLDAAGLPDPAQSRLKLRGRTTAQLTRRRAAPPRHYLAHVLIEGWVTLLVAGGGVGKTDWFLAYVAASVRARVARAKGEPPAAFCGLAVLPAKWYVLSEQTPDTILPYVRRWGLDAAELAKHVVWVTWDDACARWTSAGYEGFPTFAHVAQAAERDARAQGCDGILWDTYMQWAADTSGNVNDTGGVRRVFARFKACAAGGGWGLWRRRKLVVAVNLHTNKAGQVAGNESIKASCDVLYVMEAPDPHDERGQANVRVLSQHKSRDRESPRRLVVATDPATGVYDLYRETLKKASTAGEGGNGVGVDGLTGLAARNDGVVDDPLRKALAAAGKDGATVAELAAAAGVTRQAAHKRLVRLAQQGTVATTGRVGKPDLWRRAAKPTETNEAAA